MPGESASWDICVTPDEVPAGRYLSQFDLKFNDVGSLDYQIPVMMMSEEPPDTGNVVDERDLVPTRPTLGEIYPNPFNSAATFKYQLPTNSWLRINLYDTQGRKVQELVNGFRKAGSYTGLIHANTLPSGEYFLKFMSGGEVQVKSLLLVK